MRICNAMGTIRLMGFLLAATVVTGWLDFARASPYVPMEDSQIIERLPLRPTDPVYRELRSLRDALTQDPRNLDLAVRLAQKYIEQGRAEADPRYNGYAQAALSPWWSLPHPPIKVLVLRATLRQSNHDFNGALADLAWALKLDPNHPQAWVTQALIFQAQGEYSKAKRSCMRLYPLTTELVTITCLAGVGSQSGQAAQSFNILQATIHRNPNASLLERLWAQTVLAEIAARRGDPQAAEDQFQNAIAIGARDPYLLGAYADFLLDQGRFKEVLALLSKETRMDGLLLRLALAEKKIGSHDFSDHLNQLKARFHAAGLRGERTHQREEARFTLEVLGQPQAALKLAQENWAVQKEPADARVLLQAALLANHPEKAIPVLTWLEETGMEDWYLMELSKQFKGKLR